MISKRPTPFLALTLLLLSGACTQVLGIEDARVDPTLSEVPGGSSGATSLAQSGAQPSGGRAADGGSSTGSSGHSAVAGASSSVAGNDAAMAGASGDPDLCQSYCQAVVSNCTGAYEQYRTLAQCLEVCQQLPLGRTGDENVNSVQCRARQAYFADSEPAVYCKSAGPLGADKCGSNCVAYCSLMQATCTASSTAGNVELSYFNSSHDCMTACSALPPDPTGPVEYSSSPTAVPSSYIGNNVYCRAYHVVAAIDQEAPTEHCPHAMGGDPCSQQ
ncbi:MAG TPA: hypothetical protein VHW01_29400 [Polyangiaceae bacterium]|jgi:hypothetical protein|nr:hypothetical protein [Polyangiaceae bacterium]